MPLPVTDAKASVIGKSTNFYIEIPFSVKTFLSLDSLSAKFSAVGFNVSKVVHSVSKVSRILLCYSHTPWFTSHLRQLFENTVPNVITGNFFRLLKFLAVIIFTKFISTFHPKIPNIKQPNGFYLVQIFHSKNQYLHKIINIRIHFKYTYQTDLTEGLIWMGHQSVDMMHVYMKRYHQNNKDIKCFIQEIQAYITN